MRITNNMMSQNLLNNLEAAQGRMDDLQNELSSGHKVTKPSDDPAGIENIIRMKSTLSSVGQWQSNASAALSIMNTTDSTMSNISSMMQRIRELTVQASSDTNTSADRQTIGQEVSQLTSQIQSLANTQVGNQYIFGGTRTDQPPLPAGSTTWQGNGQDVMYQVGSSLSLPISVNGNTLFNQPVTLPDGSTTLPDGSTPDNLFNTLNQLSTLLNNPSTTGTQISDMLPSIDANQDNISALQADLGARTNRMQSISDQLDTTSNNLTQNISTIQDADLAKTITDFQNQQNVYKAALSVGAQIIQPSLVDFMK